MPEAVGKVSIVGAGPGDPELLTLKAARLIEDADDLLVDALVPAPVYQRARGRVIYVGKRAGRPHVSQDEICRILVELGLAGRRVVRLKGGDPGVFGRAAEEIDALAAAGVAWELVPGVSSALAAPALAGITPTARGVADRLLIMTAHKQASAPLPEVPPYVASQTVVLLMGLSGLPELARAALAAGYPRELPAVMVSHAGQKTQRVIGARLDGIAAAVAEAGLTAPATLVLGWTASRALAVELLDRSSCTG